MTTTRNRPGEGPRTAHETAWTAGTNDTPLASPATSDTRTRCTRCGHRLSSPRSVARGIGPKCWPRTDVGRLDQRRDAVGRKLADLASRVSRADLDGLDILSDMLTSVLDAFGGDL